MEDHVPRHAQMGAWVLINDRWYKAHLERMKKVASFSMIGVESCAVSYRNSRSKLCMQVDGDGVVREAKCRSAVSLNSGQAFGVSRNRLV